MVWSWRDRLEAPRDLARAIGLAGVAFVKAEGEVAEFNKDIILTGNYARTSADDLAGMAQSSARKPVLYLSVARAEDDQLAAECDEIVDERHQHVEALLRGQPADDRKEWSGRVVDLEPHLEGAAIGVTRRRGR